MYRSQAICKWKVVTILDMFKNVTELRNRESSTYLK